MLLMDVLDHAAPQHSKQKAAVVLALIKKRFNIEHQIKDLSEKQTDFTTDKSLRIGKPITSRY